ncbi:MAG: xanthine dehydrogenase family protein molybdopterin-binding subunit, partial [Alphaproteobacteria bacterium]
MPTTTPIGAGRSLPRLEDAELLTGRGRFVDDRNLPDQVCAVILRSTVAHARIISVDTTQAQAAPGVLGVFTGQDLAAARLGPIPCMVTVDSTDGAAMIAPPRPALALDAVRHVGDGVAMVVAETADLARDAVEMIDVAYQDQPSVTDVASAVSPEAPRVWPLATGNVAFDWEMGDADAVAAAFQAAAQVCRMRVVNNRIAICPIEPRGALGRYDADSGRYTLYTPTQGVFAVRRALAERVLSIPPDRLRVVTDEVGGSFGMKIMAYPEQALVLFAAKALGRPVKWTAERGESFLSDNHGRDHVSEVALALDGDGRFMALRVDTLANLGAYLSATSPVTVTSGHTQLLGHSYCIPAIHARVRGVFTNVAPVDAYRGAGVPEAVYLLERLIDKAARDSRRDRIELRRRNLVPADTMPYRSAAGLTYDAGDFPAAMDRALKAADWAGFPTRRAASARRGLRRGIGLACYLHATGGGDTDTCRVAARPDRTVLVICGTQSAGQGHRTAFAQLVAERLGLPLERVRVVQGDSTALAAGGGTGGSSSMSIGARVVLRAADAMLERAGALAAERMEAAVADIAYEAGTFRVVGTDRTVGLFDLADAAQPGVPGCVGEACFDGDKRTFPYGTHI